MNKNNVLAFADEDMARFMARFDDGRVSVPLIGAIAAIVFAAISLIAMVS